MPRPTTLKPANPGAGQLHAFLVKKFGSVSAGARAAGLPELTVRRYIYDPPKRPAFCVVTSLEKIGVKRDWIVAEAV